MAVDVKEIKTLKLTTSSGQPHSSGHAHYYAEQSSDSGLATLQLNGTASKSNGNDRENGVTLKLNKTNISMLHEITGRLLEEWAK